MPDPSVTPSSKLGPSAPAGHAKRTILWLFLTLLTPALLTLSFPPFYGWPLALFALAPLAVAILTQPLNRRWLVWYYLLGLAYFAENLYWLMDVTLPGYVALALYLAIYFPLFAWLLRLFFHRFHVPAILAVPITFTALEYVRCTFLSGFSWFQLGTALAPATPLLQCADLAGVWGLTFLAAIGSGWLTDLFLLRVFVPSCFGGGPRSALWKTALIQTTMVILIFAAAWFYGMFRLRQPLLNTGPRIAVIQRSIPQKVKNNASIAGDKKIFAGFLELSQQAAPQHPDLIVWPETMVPGFLNPQWLTLSPLVFRAGYPRQLLKMDQKFAGRLTMFSRHNDVSLLVGASAIRFNSRGAVRKMQNISVLFTPHHGQNPRFYAKHHLVPFGEYVPFKRSWPWLHRLLLYLTPYGGNNDYTLVPGRAWRRFTLTAGPRHWRFGTPICYEDAMPNPARMFARPRAGQKGVSFLINISNDGWYPGQAELQQHLQLDQVRAVEDRVPIARCVNGGDSGFIDSDGRVLALVTHHGQTTWVSGWAVSQLPLDPRITLFSCTGAILPQALLFLTLLAALFGIFFLFRRNPPTTFLGVLRG